MSFKDHAKATAKNVEGKAQEGLGNLSGDPKDKEEGKRKQVQAEVTHTVEDTKDELKKTID